MGPQEHSSRKMTVSLPRLFLPSARRYLRSTLCVVACAAGKSTPLPWEGSESSEGRQAGGAPEDARHVEVGELP